MPEHTELTLQLLPLEERLIGPVDSNKLVVLGDNLVGFLVVQDEILQVVLQLPPRKQALDQSLQARSFLANLFAINLLPLVLCP